MSNYLEHGRFKYIDKWKSKAGNWVYKYAESANEELKSLNDQFGPKVTKTVVAGGQERKNGPAGYDQRITETKKNLIGGRTVSRTSAYQRSGKPSKPSEWTPSKKDPSRTAWKKLGTSQRDRVNIAAGYDEKRLALYNKGREPSGVRVQGIRTEYRNSKYDAIRNKRYSIENAKSRGNAFIKTLGDLNDKYGPKFTEEQTITSSTGRVFVESYVRNLIGGKKVHVESYSYNRSK